MSLSMPLLSERFARTAWEPHRVFQFQHFVSAESASDAVACMSEYAPAKPDLVVPSVECQAVITIVEILASSSHANPADEHWEVLLPLTQQLSASPHPPLSAMLSPWGS